MAIYNLQYLKEEIDNSNKVEDLRNKTITQAKVERTLNQRISHPMTDSRGSQASDEVELAKARFLQGYTTEDDMAEDEEKKKLRTNRNRKD